MNPPPLDLPKPSSNGRNPQATSAKTPQNITLWADPIIDTISNPITFLSSSHETKRAELDPFLFPLSHTPSEHTLASKLVPNTQPPDPPLLPSQPVNPTSKVNASLGQERPHTTSSPSPSFDPKTKGEKEAQDLSLEVITQPKDNHQAHPNGSSDLDSILPPSQNKPKELLANSPAHSFALEEDTFMAHCTLNKEVVLSLSPSTNGSNIEVMDDACSLVPNTLDDIIITSKDMIDCNLKDLSLEVFVVIEQAKEFLGIHNVFEVE